MSWQIARAEGQAISFCTTKEEKGERRMQLIFLGFSAKGFWMSCLGALWASVMPCFRLSDKQI